MSNDKANDVRSIDDKTESEIIAYAAYNGIKDIITKSCTIVINVDANGESDYEYIDNSSPASADKIGGSL